MKIMKFGGSSLSTKEHRDKAIDIIKENVGDKVLVVVSAMGRYPDAYATETLKSLISTKVSFEESSRVLSVGEIISSVVLSNELIENNINSISLSSLQAGMRVDNSLFVDLNVDYINQLFELYDVIVIPGFQGINECNDVCILDLGDSDYSAVYIAKKMGCDEVFIYSDVCGIYTADPKYVKNARLIPHVSFLQAKDLAMHKARIICYKALEEGGKEEHFKIYLASTFVKGCCTLIDHRNTNIKTMSMDFDYTMINFEESIKLEDKPFIFEENHENCFVKSSSLDLLKTPFVKLGEYTKVHFVGCDLGGQEIYNKFLETFCIKSVMECDSYYVMKKNQKNDITLLHNIIIGED